MRYYVETEVEHGAREEHLVEGEEAAIVLVRRLLGENATVTIAQMPPEDAVAELQGEPGADTSEP